MRRLKLQQSASIHSGHLSRYGEGALSPLSQTLNFDGLQHITIATKDMPRDPLGMAERGKIGLPHSSSECSSNSSVEASVESNTGIVNGEQKGKIDYAYPFVNEIILTSNHYRSSFDYFGVHKTFEGNKN